MRINVESFVTKLGKIVMSSIKYVNSYKNTEQDIKVSTSFLVRYSVYIYDNILQFGKKTA